MKKKKKKTFSGPSSEAPVLWHVSQQLPLTWHYCISPTRWVSIIYYYTGQNNINKEMVKIYCKQFQELYVSYLFIPVTL